VRSSLLDLLRILAISLVLVQHSAMWLNQSWPPIYYIKGLNYVSLGHLGVTIFLLVSGIALRLNDRGQGVAAFYTRRLQRIYPVYWMALALSLAMGLVFHWDNFPKDWVEGALTITGLCVFAGRLGCWLTPAWFIGLILSFYAVYPWLSRLINRAPRITLEALLLISLASRLSVDGYLPNYPTEWFPLCRVFEFGLGIYLAQEVRLAPALRWRAPAPISRILEILGELSFPAFLVHWLFRNVYWHLGPPLHVLVFLIMTISVSFVVLSVDSYLQRALFGAARGSCSPVVFKLSVARKAWTSLWGGALRRIPCVIPRPLPRHQPRDGRPARGCAMRVTSAANPADLMRHNVTESGGPNEQR